MINPPPKTGDVALDGFLRSVYEQSKELEAKAIPEDGWSLTDFTAEVSGVIGDKRDLIDIVTQYDSIEDYLALVDDQKQLLEDALTKVESIEVSADWFAQIMEWWDQNYKIIQDAQTSLYYKREADAAALEAKQHAEKTEQDRVATGQSLADAREAASDAASYRQSALTYRDSSKRYSEASEAAQALSEAAQALSEQFRDGAKAHREATKVSETNAAASASAASTDANKSAGSATEAAGEVTKAEAAREQVEAVEAALRALMADTEAWQDVSFALESVDNRISTGMQTVKDDILGGVGPAFDTLLELAEALGDNADAIGTLTNELAKKAEKGHTHASADITDATSVLHANYPDRVVKTRDDGQIYVYTDTVTKGHSVANKTYVDEQVGKKANTSHTHTISETSGLQTALDGKAPESHIHSIGEVDGLEAQLDSKSDTSHTHGLADLPHTTNANGNTLVSRSAAGNFFVNDPAHTNHPASMGYVDNAAAQLSGSGASIIPSVEGVQTWAKSLPQTVGSDIPTGRAYHCPPGETAKTYDNPWTSVDPSLDYYASIWVKADKPGSRIYIYLRADNGHVNSAISSGSFSGGSGSLLADYEIPTEWTLLETHDLRFNPEVGEVKLGTFFFNHTNGTERGAIQYLTDLQLIPIPKLSSKDISDASYRIGSNYTSGTVVTAHPTDGDIYRYGTAEPNNSAVLVNKFYVDREVGKKADTSHTHPASDIEGAGFSGGEVPNRVMVTSSSGRLYYDRAATASNEIVNKEYVDAEVAKKANTSHTHAISDVNGLQAAINDAAGAATWSELAGKPSTFPPSTHSHSWSQVTGKPSTFTPSSHSHSISDVTGLEAALNAKANSSHSHSWGQVTGKPSTFTPSSHTHTWSQVTGKPDVATKGYVDERTPPIEVVDSLPSSPAADTLYFVKE